jgi:glutamate synthase (NADPH/NADH) large chain
VAFLPAADTARTGPTGTDATDSTGTPNTTTVTTAFEKIAAEEGLSVLAWRAIPINPTGIGKAALDSMPDLQHVIVTDPQGELHGLDLDRRTFRLRRRAYNELGLYLASLSARTITHKGMLTAAQLADFYCDFADPRFTSTLALAHLRFSTNTFPTWSLAQPLRMIAHNGEINTVRGNRNWIAAREGSLNAPALGDLGPLMPICTPGSSDSASFDEVVELLHLSGRSLPHAVAMMIPEAWEKDTEMDPARRAFYEWHGNLIEPWDGPAALTFTDGTQIGAVLDRNGLRPGRYCVTSDGLVVLASETGVLDIDPATVVTKGRLEPGKMFLVDTAEGRIIPDREVKQSLATAKPYQQWLDDYQITLESLPEREHIAHTAQSVRRRQAVFGYTTEELRLILTPAANSGAEALGSMGTDTPIAVLSARPRLLFDYFTQMFAQVTNPPLDSIREELVTSVGSAIGPEPNILAEEPDHARKLILDFPVINNDQLAKIVHVNKDERLEGLFRAHVVRGLYPVAGGGAALRDRLAQIFDEADAAIAEGATHIVLSDRESNQEFAPIPSLLLTSAVHHHLLRRRTRTRISLVVEAGDVREVHHVALLIGYGAACVNPYLAMESVEDLVTGGYVHVPADQAVANLIYALGKGVLKVMSKMGISTIMSYRAAQVFEAVGLAQDVIDCYFTGTTSRLGGIGLDVIAAEVAARHADAYPPSGNPRAHQELTAGGEYQWRRGGEEHLFDPETVFRLQHATRTADMTQFRKYSRRIDEQAERLMTLRGLLRFKPDRDAIAVDQVEPISAIVSRFNTGAMSFGSISAETHETLARAMNRLGGRSNTGEGGENPSRLYDPDTRSRVKQVASGRFGVTSEYLASADDIQIKLAQGAKPGEGGQLPGPKVYPWVAEVRHSTPGVGLVSPPPHHDIYSIEDLAQLIHDCKNANPNARIHVKLASQFGVGTVAAGVVKTHADVVLISGHDGGTGASPLTSLKHAGTPWEIGLAEAQQTLILNGLRDRVTLQVDGQLKTGRDVVIAALLGAEEFGFATTAMVVTGCVMMRACHLDTCPTGVATQNPHLRSRFTGKVDHVVTFFEFIAQEVRETLASLGFRSIDEAVGQVHIVDSRKAVEHWKTSGLDLAPIIAGPADPAAPRRRLRDQDHGLDQALDHQLIADADPAITTGAAVTLSAPVSNINRSVGTMLGYHVTTQHRGAGLPDNTITVNLTGSAGQSLGAFLPRGITLRLEGDANDYVGKSLSGGRITVRPDATAHLDGTVIAGNVIGYGATAGEIFLRGVVGERFGVRNSGATLVAEGVGDHALEYMTGGTVVILGPTGRNLGAGFSGGVAYVRHLQRNAVNTAAVTSGQLELAPLSDADWDIVADLLTRHADETGSPAAAALLADPVAARAQFTRVHPPGWVRVREALAEAEAEGVSLDGTPETWDESRWNTIVEVARG